METIAKAKRRIESEFNEPLSKVVEGFANMGYSAPMVADVLEVSPKSLASFRDRNGIHFHRAAQESRRPRGRPARRIRNGNAVHTVSGWAMELGVSEAAIYKRLARRGKI